MIAMFLHWLKSALIVPHDKHETDEMDAACKRAWEREMAWYGDFHNRRGRR